MKSITFNTLSSYVMNILKALGMTTENRAIMSGIYIETIKRGIGHHDIYSLPSRLDLLIASA